MNTKASFIFLIIRYAGGAGAIVGFFWSLALDLNFIYCVLWSAGINASIFVAYGLAATARGRVSQNDAVAAIGMGMVPLDGIAVIAALITWLIRSLI